MFNSDKAIQSNNEDLLKRGAFAAQLADAIVSLKSDDTYTIGLFGKWGSGKTSLVNMAIEYLEKKQRDITDDETMVIVRFDPWIFTDVKQLIPQFFKHLTSIVASKKDDRSQKIGKALEEYSDSLEILEAIPVVGKILSVTGKTAAESFGKHLSEKLGGNDLIKQKEYVEKALAEYNRRILVVIDDIDRLSNEQIRGIFQLVTAVAKLPRITYLLVFDKEIVANALQEIQKCDGNEYLEKVIQAPITLPELRQVSLNQIIGNEFEKLFKLYPDTGFEPEYWQEQYYICVAPFIKTIRDVRRLINVLEFKLAAISSEVDFADMVIITTIELFQPSLYSWIVENIDALIESDASQRGGIQKRAEEWYALYKEQLVPLIRGNYSADLIIRIFCMLFPKFSNRIGITGFGKNQDYMRANNKIGHPDKCERYFQLNPAFVGVKKTDLHRLLYEYDKENIICALKQYDQDENCYELISNVKSEIDSVPLERIKIIIDALLITTPFLKKDSMLEMITARSSAVNLTFELMAAIPDLERFEYLKALIGQCDIYSLSTFAHVLNYIELSYGRLAANGRENSYEKLVSVDELELLEKEFLQHAKTLLIDQSLFSTNDWQMLFWLLKNYDSVFAKGCIEQLLGEDINVLKYIAASVSASISLLAGITNSYVIKDDYKEFVSFEKAKQAIDNCVNKKELNGLDEDEQLKVAAFYLMETDSNEYFVRKESAKKQLQGWLHA